MWWKGIKIPREISEIVIFVGLFTISGLMEIANNWTRIGCSTFNSKVPPIMETFLENLPSENLVVQQRGLNVSGK